MDDRKTYKHTDPLVDLTLAGFHRAQFDFIMSSSLYGLTYDIFETRTLPGNAFGACELDWFGAGGKMNGNPTDLIGIRKLMKKKNYICVNIAG